MGNEEEVLIDAMTMSIQWRGFCGCSVSLFNPAQKKYFHRVIKSERLSHYRSFSLVRIKFMKLSCGKKIIEHDSLNFSTFSTVSWCLTTLQCALYFHHQHTYTHTEKIFKRLLLPQSSPNSQQQYSTVARSRCENVCRITFVAEICV